MQDGEKWVLEDENDLSNIYLVMLEGDYKNLPCFINLPFPGILGDVNDMAAFAAQMVNKKMKESEINDILADNDNLLNYLNLLSQFINANPGLLNKDYPSGPTEEKVGDISGGLKERGV